MSGVNKKLQRIILQKAKFKNLILSPDATNFLIDTIQNDEKILDIIFKKLVEQKTNNKRIEIVDIQNVLNKKEEEEHDDIQIINYFNEECFGEAIDKASIHRERYKLLLKRCSNISSIESLTGTGSNETKNILGLLSIRSGKYYLEDLNSSVKLDLTVNNFYVILIFLECKRK